MTKDTHSVLLGYVLWLFGFSGAHRFYYGRPVSGTIWFCTLGLFLIGWLVDLFLIPGMDRDADRRYAEGPKDYSIAFLLLTFLGAFGAHRLYLGKWITGLIYLFIAVWIVTPYSFISLLLLLGYLYDFWTLNEQVDEVNRNLRSQGDDWYGDTRAFRSPRT